MGAEALGVDYVVFPACAGMNRFDYLELVAVLEFSPHARG